jgi:hypothetical protein
MKAVSVAVAAALAVAAVPSEGNACSLDEFIAQASEEPEHVGPYSCWQLVYTGNGGEEVRTPWKHNLLTTTASGYTCGYDWLAKAMGAGPSTAFASAQGTATSTGSTSLTNTGATFPTSGQGLAGCIVVAGANSSGTGAVVYGVITKNTATVLTVDQWYSGTSTSGAAGSTPNGTAQYMILPGQNPAAWLCLSASSFTPNTADVYLGSQNSGAELTTNGFSRAVGTYSHTAAGSTFSLVYMWTASGTETINNEGISGAAAYSTSSPQYGGVFPFESAEPSPPTLVSGDTLQNTCTITI